jgi:hypothetical protein
MKAPLTGAFFIPGLMGVFIATSIKGCFGIPSQPAFNPKLQMPGFKG